ncbi:hypothetical protein ZWY2020_008868 [Hordeum vulgare]|nr:hypothetical protein ZWY2020_057833 [Hordeum vulgare]KAI5007820.1 hypothetical protein ZWY2020_008868 [Hordeum vulgare]
MFPLCLTGFWALTRQLAAGPGLRLGSVGPVRPTSPSDRPTDPFVAPTPTLFVFVFVFFRRALLFGAAAALPTLALDGGAAAIHLTLRVLRTRFSTTRPVRPLLLSWVA